MITLVVLSLLGCKDPEEVTPEAQPLTLVTYNAGLATGFVAGAESRTPQIGAALAALDADVVCLQEVWTPEQVQAVADATAAAFPHQHFPDALPSDLTGAPACADGDLDDLITCLEDSCADVCGDDLPDCVFTYCPIPFLFLPPTCQGCAMAMVGEDVPVVQDTCETVPETYAYGASFGTGILSKHPITSVEQLTFASTTNRRAALHAIIEAPEGPIDVYCTHLSAVFTTIPYPRETGSWAEEQAVQINQLVDWVDETMGAGPVFVLGDLNTGPAVGTEIEAEVPENWALFEATGWTSAYAEGAPECTYCASNPLVGEDPSVLLDHVFRVDSAESSASERVFTEEIEADRCGETIPAALSDHYGVSVTF